MADTLAETTRTRTTTTTQRPASNDGKSPWCVEVGLARRAAASTSSRGRASCLDASVIERSTAVDYDSAIAATPGWPSSSCGTLHFATARFGGDQRRGQHRRHAPHHGRGCDDPNSSAGVAGGCVSFWTDSLVMPDDVPPWRAAPRRTKTSSPTSRGPPSFIYMDDIITAYKKHEKNYYYYSQKVLLFSSSSDSFSSSSPQHHNSRRVRRKEIFSNY